MPTFIILIVLSFFIFLMYQIKATRTKHTLLKKFNQSKANIAIGIFLISFGLNRLFVHPSVLTYIVTGVFVFYGLFFTYDYIRRSRFYYHEIQQKRSQGSL